MGSNQEIKTISRIFSRICAPGLLTLVLLLGSLGVPAVAAAVCGDGVVDAAETCDDGGTAAGDGCSDVCVVESGWACDTAEPTTCNTVCGDSIVAGAEQCDGEACCDVSCNFEAASVICREGVGICDMPDQCTGSSGACPSDVLRDAFPSAFAPPSCFVFVLRRCKRKPNDYRPAGGNLDEIPAG